MTSIPAEVPSTSTSSGSHHTAAARGLPATAMGLLFAVVLVAGTVVGSSLPRLPSAEGWQTFIALAICTGVAQLFVVSTGKNAGFNTGIVFLVAAALLLPLELVVLMGLAQHGVEGLKKRYPWYIQTFNIANATLNVAAAWWAAHAVIGLGAGGPALGQAFGGLAAATVLIGLNHVLLAAMLRLGRGRTLRETGLFSVTGLSLDLLVAVLGVAVAHLWSSNPWLVPAVVGPLLLSHRSFSLLAMLRESEERFRAMFESAAVGSALVDLKGKIVSSNRELEDLLAYGKEELARKTADSLVHPDDAERDRRLFAELVAGERDTYQVESRYVASDGTVVWGQVAVALVRDADEKPRFAISMVQDVSERKQAEEALRQSEERYRELFENANDMVFTLDLDGNFTAINRSGERITGYERDELLGRNFAQLVAPEDAESTYGLAGDGDARTFECSIIARDGRRVPIEVASRLIREHGEAVGVQAIARDVSERRELEEKLRQAQKLEAIGLLAGGVAHDFNNMLTAITGYSDFALAALDTGRGVRRADIEEIAKAAERAGALTSQLLAFSRKQILRLEVVDLNDVVGEMDKLLRRLIGEHIDVVTAFGAGLGRVKADRSQLEQVIVNLAVNARDAMPNGGKLVIETANADPEEIAAHAPELVPGPHVLLTVADTGCGMDAATQARIFEPFFTTKGRGQGTGLGLATVYGVVKQSGGHISVESEPGAGTKYRIYLPRVDEPVAIPDDGVEPVESASGSETVLLVEDEEIVRKLIRDTLRRAGYTVVEAEDGAAAMRICERRSDPIDIVVTDVVMPNMTGPELIERLAPSQPHLKVLYVSGYTDGRVTPHEDDDAAPELLMKPFTPNLLARKVRELLDSPTELAAGRAAEAAA
jgi:two-component system cell cycle sensor histidine kinase/response regulator CckA